MANASQQSRTTDKCNCFHTLETNLVKAILNRIDAQWLFKVVYFMTFENKNDFIIRTSLIINVVRGKRNKFSP